MGVTFQEFKFLEYINNSINFGNVLTIGRQELILNTKDKIRLNLLNTEFSNDKFIDNLLLKKFKAISVNSLNNSDYIYQWNEVNKRKINSKKNTSIIWKKFKNKKKSIFYENILPLKLSERLQGKKISKKNLYNKNKYLKKIKFYDYK